MSIPEIPLSTTLLIAIVAISVVPGTVFPPSASGAGRRPLRLTAGLILGSLAGWLFGSSTLASGLPIAPTVLALLSATVIFAEGMAGRGWPWAGALSATVYLSALVLDLLDRTGERMSWMHWPVLIGIAVFLALIVQFVWRGLWSRTRRSSKPDSAPPLEQ